MLLELIINRIGLKATAVVLDLFWQLPLLWALFKVSYQKGVGRPMPRILPVIIVDVAIEMMTNVPGALNRAWRESGGAPIFKKPEDAPERPSILLPVLVVLAVFFQGCSAQQSVAAAASWGALWSALTTTRDAVCSDKLTPILDAMARLPPAPLDGAPSVPQDASADAAPGGDR